LFGKRKDRTGDEPGSEPMVVDLAEASRSDADVSPSLNRAIPLSATEGKQAASPSMPEGAIRLDLMASARGNEQNGDEDRLHSENSPGSDRGQHAKGDSGSSHDNPETPSPMHPNLDVAVDDANANGSFAEGGVPAAWSSNQLEIDQASEVGVDRRTRMGSRGSETPVSELDGGDGTDLVSRMNLATPITLLGTGRSSEPQKHLQTTPNGPTEDLGLAPTPVAVGFAAPAEAGNDDTDGDDTQLLGGNGALDAERPLVQDSVSNDELTRPHRHNLGLAAAGLGETSPVVGKDDIIAPTSLADTSADASDSLQTLGTLEVYRHMALHDLSRLGAHAITRENARHSLISSAAAAIAEYSYQSSHGPGTIQGKGRMEAGNEGQASAAASREGARSHLP